MSSNPPAERARPGPWSPTRWSLRLRLLAGQLVVLVAVVVGIGIATELALQQFLVHQLDDQLVDLQNRSLAEMGGGPRFGPPPPTVSASTTQTSAPPIEEHEAAPTTTVDPPTTEPEPTTTRAPRPMNIPPAPLPTLSGNGSQNAPNPGRPAGPAAPPPAAPPPAVPPRPGGVPQAPVPRMPMPGFGIPLPGMGGRGVSTHPAQVSEPVPDPPPPPFGPPHSTGPGPSFLSRPGIPAGTIGALVRQGAVVSAARIGDDGAQAVLSSADDTRLAVVAPAGRGETLTLDGRRYRVIADSTWQGAVVVTGLPMAGVDAILMRGLLILLVVTVGALFVAITLGIWLIRRALAPLDRMVGTAARVADLRLDRGEVVLPVRVPSADADTGTEVGKLGSAVNHMLDHVADALTARYDSEIRVRRFLADASHELRTPLSAIRGYTELAQRNRSAVPESVADAMSRVDAAARRMSALVEDMLLLARLDSGRPLERAAVDLSQLTVDAISDAHIAGPQHRWDLDLPDDPVVINGDAARLHQVLANLLANARLHTPLGTLVTVMLDTDTHGGAVWWVCDNGPGIPRALQGEIFERFARGDSSRSRHAGSTGLGLAIVAAVVKAHGGDITVDSEPGRTEFTVRLPGVVVDADE